MHVTVTTLPGCGYRVFTASRTLNRVRAIPVLSGLATPTAPPVSAHMWGRKEGSLNPLPSPENAGALAAWPQFPGLPSATAATGFARSAIGWDMSHSDKRAPNLAPWALPPVGLPQRAAPPKTAHWQMPVELAKPHRDLVQRLTGLGPGGCPR